MGRHPLERAEDDGEERRRRQRPWSTYASVAEWWADYRGFVPIQQAAGIDQVMRQHGCTFAEAYRALLRAGAIIPIKPIAGEAGDVAADEPGSLPVPGDGNEASTRNRSPPRPSGGGTVRL